MKTKFKVGDIVKVTKDGASMSPVNKGDKGTIVSIHGEYHYVVKMNINRLSRSNGVWHFFEEDIKRIHTTTQLFKLIKKTSSKGPPVLKKHTLKEALTIIYKNAKLGFNNTCIDFTDYKKAKELSSKLKKIGFNVWINKRLNWIELDWKS